MAITVVQKKSQLFAAPAGASSLQFNSNVTAGNAIMVCISCFGLDLLASMVTDGLSNTYALGLTAASNGTNSDHSALIYALNIAGGTCNVTFTPGSGGHDVTLAILEISGLATSAALDQTQSGVSAGNTTALTTGTTGTTGQASEYVIACFAPDGIASGISSLSAGYTNEQEIDTTTNMPIVVADQIVSSTGTQACTATNSSSLPFAAVIVTFKGASAGAADIYPAGSYEHLPAYNRPHVRM